MNLELKYRSPDTDESGQDEDEDEDDEEDEEDEAFVPPPASSANMIINGPPTGGGGNLLHGDGTGYSSGDDSRALLSLEQVKEDDHSMS